MWCMLHDVQSVVDDDSTCIAPVNPQTPARHMRYASFIDFLVAGTQCVASSHSLVFLLRTRSAAEYGTQHWRGEISAESMGGVVGKEDGTREMD